MSLTSSYTRAPFSKRALSSLDWINLLDRDSSVVGKDALRLNAQGWNNTVLGYQAASLGATGDDNVAVGTRAARRAEGSRNTALGTAAFGSNVSGFDNVAVGYRAGGVGGAGDENTFLGGLAGLEVDSSGNVALGFRSCAGEGACEAGGNVALGWRSEASGGGALALGAEARADGGGSLALGAGASCSGAGSVALGADVTVSGRGALVLMPRRDGQPSSHSADEELNVFGVLTGQREPVTELYRVNLRSDVLRLEADETSVTLDGQNTTIAARSNVIVTSPLVAAAGLMAAAGVRINGDAMFNDPAFFNSTVTFNRDVRIAGRLLLDQSEVREGEFTRLRVHDGATVGGLLTASNLLAGVVTAASVIAGDLTASRLTLAEPLRVVGGLCNLGGAVFEGETVVSGGQLLLEREGLAQAGLAVSGAPLRTTAGLRVEAPGEADFHTYAHFHAGAFFHGPVDAVGTANFDRLTANSFHTPGDFSCEDIVCETLRVNRQLVVAGTSTLSNLDVLGDTDLASLDVRDTATLSVASVSTLFALDATACNLLAADVLATRLGGQNVYGYDAGFSNLRVSGNAVIDGNLTVMGTINGSVDVIITPVVNDNTVFANDITVLGSITGIEQVTFADGLRMQGDLETYDEIVLYNRLDPAGLSRWRIRLAHPDAAKAPEYADLEFRSWKNTLFTVSQDFEQGVLNFTGSHRCAFEGGLCEADEPGTIVVASGRYMALDGHPHPRVSESLPVVRPSQAPLDPRGFGVLAGPEEDGADGRRFRLANLCFSLDKSGDPAGRRVVVNSAGEGAVLVCDENGPIRNGDLLATSSLRGTGMRQGDAVVANHTVAKATCDMDFSEGGGDWAWRTCPATGAARRVALVGCVYKF